MPDLIHALLGKRIERRLLLDGDQWGQQMRDAFAKRLAENYYRPRDFTDLSFAFVDTEGRKYYAYHNLAELPTTRFNHLQGALRMADAGFDRKEGKYIGGEVLRLNERILKAKSADERSLAHAELAVIAHELLIEGAEVIPEDVYYDMAATCCVREDEHPDRMDHTIQLQKWKMFQEAGRLGASFFLHMPLFGQLLQQSLISEQALMELLPIWSRERKRRTTIREVFAQRSSEQRRTSASSSAGSPTTTKPNMKP